LHFRRDRPLDLDLLRPSHPSSALSGHRLHSPLHLFFIIIRFFFLRGPVGLSPSFGPRSDVYILCLFFLGVPLFPSFAISIVGTMPPPVWFPHHAPGCSLCHPRKASPPLLNLAFEHGTHELSLHRSPSFRIPMIIFRNPLAFLRSAAPPLAISRTLCGFLLYGFSGLPSLFLSSSDLFRDTGRSPGYLELFLPSLFLVSIRAGSA